MFLRKFKRIASDSSDEVCSTLSPQEQRELQRHLAQDAERTIESIAARHLGVHLKAAVFQRTKLRRTHTIALARHVGAAPLMNASQRQALANDILERYLAAARHQGLLPIDQVVWCEFHVAALDPLCSQSAAEGPPIGVRPLVAMPSKRPS